MEKAPNKFITTEPGFVPRTCSANWDQLLSEFTRDFLSAPDSTVRKSKVGGIAMGPGGPRKKFDVEPPRSDVAVWLRGAKLT